MVFFNNYITENGQKWQESDKNRKSSLSLIKDQKLSKKCKIQILSWLGSFQVFRKEIRGFG